MAMAVLMLLPLTMTAQYDENRFGLQPWFGSSLLGRESNRDGNGNISLGSATQEDPTETPLGSGIMFFMTAGIGYAIMKRKEDQK